MMVFCTLFDSNYLDKGLVMYRSLVSTGCSFKMYVLAMDGKCLEILRSYSYPNLFLISIEEFVRSYNLEAIQKERPRGEFCWTCTSFLIDNVLTEFHEEICTYVDSDLYFFANPECLIDEMNEKSVQILEHRYNDSVLGHMSHKTSGTYCVQFNTFRNTKDSLKLLRWWEEQCIRSCTIAPGGEGVWGDQGYLEDWGNYDFVGVLHNLGGGVAPWNVAQYSLADNKNDDRELMLCEKKTGDVFRLIFYHFHNVNYLSRYKVRMNVYEIWKADKDLIELIYTGYLTEVDAVKEELYNNFGYMPMLMSHPAVGQQEKSKAKRREKLFRRRDDLFQIIYYKTVGSCLQRINDGRNLLTFDNNCVEKKE